MTPELSEDEDVAHILCNSLAVLPLVSLHPSKSFKEALHSSLCINVNQNEFDFENLLIAL